MLIIFLEYIIDSRSERLRHIAHMRCVFILELEISAIISGFGAYRFHAKLLNSTCTREYNNIDISLWRYAGFVLQQFVNDRDGLDKSSSKRTAKRKFDKRATQCNAVRIYGTWSLLLPRALMLYVRGLIDMSVYNSDICEFYDTQLTVRWRLSRDRACIFGVN